MLYKDYIYLKDYFNILYLNNLINNNIFFIFFSYNNILNKDLYNIKNEISKKNLKSLTINSKYMQKLFEQNFKFFNSNVIFIFFNNIADFAFLLQLLNNIKIFYSFNKNF